MKNDRIKYLVVGNSTAAVGAIEGIRSIDPETPIVLFSDETYHTYSRPLISYLLAGEVDENQMDYRSRDFYRQNLVETRLGTEVVAIEPKSRMVQTADGDKIAFDNLLIATGGKPFVPEIEGLELASPDDEKSRRVEGVFTFTSRDDAKNIEWYIKEREVDKAVVLGGGLIGIKSAEALHALGVEVLMVELAERLLPIALDEKGASMAAEHARDAGIQLQCGTTVDRIASRNGRVSAVHLETGDEVKCDLVIVAIGVVPNIGCLRSTSIETDRGILINDRCQTNIEGIYAAGDVSQGRDALTGQSRPIPIFPNAFRQGTVAGINMAGGQADVGTLFAMNSVEVFGLPTISVGLSTASGEPYEVISRTVDEPKAYRRFVLRKNRIVGALLVGDIDRAGIVTGLIRHRIDVSSVKDLLLRDEFGLISLPADYRKHVVQGEGIEV